MYFFALSDFLYACTHEEGDDAIGPFWNKTRKECWLWTARDHEVLLLAPVPPYACHLVSFEGEVIDGWTFDSLSERCATASASSYKNIVRRPASAPISMLPALAIDASRWARELHAQSKVKLSKNKICGAQPVPIFWLPPKLRGQSAPAKRVRDPGNFVHPVSSLMCKRCSSPGKPKRPIVPTLGRPFPPAPRLPPGPPAGDDWSDLRWRIIAEVATAAGC